MSRETAMRRMWFAMGGAVGVFLFVQVGGLYEHFSERTYAASYAYCAVMLIIALVIGLLAASEGE